MGLVVLCKLYQHRTVGHKFRAAFEVDEASGSEVTEDLAKDISSYLCIVPDDKKARAQAEQ